MQKDGFISGSHLSTTQTQDAITIWKMYELSLHLVDPYDFYNFYILYSFMMTAVTIVLIIL